VLWPEASSDKRLVRNHPLSLAVTAFGTALLSALPGVLFCGQISPHAATLTSLTSNFAPL
jgi:hypothetical protein